MTTDDVEVIVSKVLSRKLGLEDGQTLADCLYGVVQRAFDDRCGEMGVRVGGGRYPVREKEEDDSD